MCHNYQIADANEEIYRLAAKLGEATTDRPFASDLSSQSPPDKSVIPLAIRMLSLVSAAFGERTQVDH